MPESGLHRSRSNKSGRSKRNDLLPLDSHPIDGVPSLERLVEYVESELAAMRKSEVRRP